MKILFVGDVVGRVGRNVVKQRVPALRRKEAVDFVVVNVENAAGGYGVTPAVAEEFFRLGADVLTSGNHVWDQKEILEYLDRQPKLLRPANYPPTLPGEGVWVGRTAGGVDVAVVNLQGRVFMPLTDCPFRRADELLEKLQEKTRVVVVDFHAEATSEKMAFGWYLDGRVSAVLGTHTHVPTADARILPKGSAYITDVGMTGSYDSVIGMKREPSIHRFLTGIGGRHEPETKGPRFAAVLLEVDPVSGRALRVERCDEAEEP
ncbi:MAG TPA: TIGR00282 family metallophosphoesterase [Acidobacteriota bacterium]|jgi:hypothetical protein|nr:TIGR00282 family metallophosphoesterase [Acidobacteriota bacterium]HRR57539.1 TIGR00282 family metallophosphoesterase [Acidobacteriota bacterium]HRV09530.1 TIGR00282 family metallophosphoesterase [Acidobacteriota bacterium]